MNTAKRSSKTEKLPKKVAPPFDLECFVPYRLLRITARLTAIASKRYADRLGVTIAESRVINVLASKGPMSTFEIADNTGMDRAKVSRATQRLTAGGQLTRAVNKNDKRLILLTLTDSGWALYSGILEVLEQFESEVRAAIHAEGSEQLLGLIAKLDRAFETFPPDVVLDDESK